MKDYKKIIPLVLLLITLLGSLAFASDQVPSEVKGVGRPSITVSGTTATCTAKVTYYGKAIDATLELWQGSTLIASWHKTGTGTVTFSETATIVHGLTYTLSLSGTADGVAFTPQSITKTL